MGKKHKRSKAHSRFLLQVRLFCQKTCKTYDFVLLFQSENAKTEISITHHLRRISSASADYPLRSESLIPQQNWRWSLWAGAFSIAKRRTHGLIRKNERAYPPLGGAGAAQVGRTGGWGRRIGGGHRVYRHGAALYHRKRHPRRQRAHPDGIHRPGHRAGAGRHPAAAGA